MRCEELFRELVTFVNDESGIICVTKSKEVTHMAKHTIEELYRGEKYDILSAEFGLK